LTPETRNDENKEESPPSDDKPAFSLKDSDHGSAFKVKQTSSRQDPYANNELVISPIKIPQEGLSLRNMSS